MAQKIDPRFIEALLPAFRLGDANVDRKLEEAGNILRVAELFHAIAREDYAAFGDLLAEDVILEIIGPAGSPMAGRHRGRAQVVEAVTGNFALVEDQRAEILSVVAQGDTVVVVGRDEGRFRPTGRRYTVHWMYQFTLAAGKLVRIRELFDSASLLAAASPEVK
jgi:ketosteroid isomerase-like protein